MLAARFLFTRCQRLPDGCVLHDMLEATELFVAAYPFAPAAVPEPLREVCAELSSRPPGVEHVAWHDEAIDLLDAARAASDPAMVDQAIGLLASAALAARADANLPYYLSHLGTAWLDRFRMTGHAADLDYAITAHQRALATHVPVKADQAGHLANYGDALLARFEHQGDTRDLDTAVTADRAAVELAQAAMKDAAAQLTPGGDPDQGRAAEYAARTALSNLAAALAASFDCRRDRADLDEAARAAREAKRLTPEDHPDRPGVLANLAQIALELFTRFWQVSDLEEALTAAGTAARAAVAGNPARPMSLVALALAYSARFSYTGDLRDLDEAIKVSSDAIAATPAGHPGRPGCLSNYASLLRQRYEAIGDTHALKEAVTAARNAVEETPVGHFGRPGFLNNLGNILRGRFEAVRAPADIEESVTVLDQAVAAAPPHAADRPGFLANLASSLVTESGHKRDLAPLERATALLQRDIATADGHPLRHLYLSALGNVWRARFDTTGDETALEEGIGLFRQAAEAVPDDHPRRPEYLGHLGSLLRRRFDRNTCDVAAGREALDVCQSAATARAAPAVVRTLAARNWGDVAAGLGDATAAMDGLAAAVGLMDQVAWQGLHRSDQERQLGRFVALACDAAACAIKAGHPAKAVELLEQGRGVLLTQALNRRARYHDLNRAPPGLARQLASINDRLERMVAAEDLMNVADSAWADRHAEVTAERDTVLEQIQALPGFSDFLKRPDFAILRDAAAAGPVVIINVSSYRCDALIVTTAGVRVTELPNLSGADAVRQVTAFVEALSTVQKAGLDPAVQATADQTIAAVLAWLWDAVISPLLPDLLLACGTVTDGHRPRVWWCPTGPLTFLPLHAAGHHDSSGQTILDHVVSSYAPTLRLLRQARRRPSGEPGDSRPLLVALPVTPGQQNLSGAEREADDFAKRFTAARQLRGPQATVEAVSRALSACPPWAHFACHGIQDVADPSAGHLILHDGPLSIAEISELRLDHAELTFLSACETSRGGAALADEAITIATAFHLAGCSHVVGTLWAIADRLAPAAANDVYEALSQPGPPGIEPSTTALAVDAAVRALRDKCPGMPRRWAPYIHIGP